MEPMLYGPLVRMAEPLVKWATEVTRLEDLPRIMRRAAKIALSPPTGPVFLSLPGDILNTEAKIDLGKPTRVIDTFRPSHSSIELIAKQITKYKKPVIIVGHEIATYNAFKEITMFAELSGSAVYQQTVPHGSHFPSEHIAFMGTLPRLQNPTKKILENYDLLICVGCDGLRMSVWSNTEPLPSKMPIIHIGINEWEIGKNYYTELAIIGNVKNTLHDINQYLKKTLASKEIIQAKVNLENIAKNNWTVKRKNIIAKTLDDRLKKPITPNWLMMNLANNISKNNIVVEEGLVSTRSLLNYLPYKNNKDFYGLASGGIGWAISGAIGVSLANPNKTIIAIIGDGSSMYGIQSLWTAAHYKLPIIYIIANNQSYRIIKERLEAFHKNTNFVGMDFDKPKIDFLKLANSLGIKSETIDKPKNIDTIFNRVFKYKKPYLLNVMVDKGY
jgi:benzoylformate decarboxylase